ncbi:MAG: N-acetylglucosamine-6-phosphate deacetylase [Burkholderiaceae bacterium]|nr:N-acetylglucosamine-6-phosphate deacetylase [Microbacteriaceae bacterium]
MLVTGDLITATGHGAAPPADETIDLTGRTLAPGFIDLHAHGGAGFSFDDGREAIGAALALHRRHGTTRSVLSLVASPMERLVESLAVIADLVDADPLVLGSHLEGPFLSQDYRGAHQIEHLRPPVPREVEALIDAGRGTIRQLTIAPELPGALAAIDTLVAAGITVAIGHTAADFALSSEAFSRGARLLTHAFNAMPGIHHRAPGPVVAALGDPRVVLELILDGHHVHPEVAAMAFRSAPGRIALVTDAMAAAGSADGDYRLGDVRVTVLDSLATISGTSTIAGSTLTIDAALRRAILETHLEPVAAIEAVTLTPARALGLDGHLGLLAPGYAADAVVLDAEWAVTSVWAAGCRLH